MRGLENLLRNGVYLSDASCTGRLVHHRAAARTGAVYAIALRNGLCMLGGMFVTAVTGGNNFGQDDSPWTSGGAK